MKPPSRARTRRLGGRARVERRLARPPSLPRQRLGDALEPARQPELAAPRWAATSRGRGKPRGDRGRGRAARRARR